MLVFQCLVSPFYFLSTDGRQPTTSAVVSSRRVTTSGFTGMPLLPPPLACVAPTERQRELSGFPVSCSRVAGQGNKRCNRACSSVRLRQSRAVHDTSLHSLRIVCDSSCLKLGQHCVGRISRPSTSTKHHKTALCSFAWCTYS